MNEFSQMLQSWQTFYATIASASATLAGLLFLSLSINRARLDEHARRFARGTFGNLICVLVLSLLFLVPNQEPIGLSVGLLAFGVAVLMAHIVESLSLSKQSQFSAIAIARLVALPMVLSVAIIVVGVMVYLHRPSAMYWPIAIIGLLLGSASWNAWDILLKE